MSDIREIYKLAGKTEYSDNTSNFELLKLNKKKPCGYESVIVNAAELRKLVSNGAYIVGNSRPIGDVVHSVSELNNINKQLCVNGVPKEKRVILYNQCDGNLDIVELDSNFTNHLSHDYSNTWFYLHLIDNVCNKNIAYINIDFVPFKSITNNINVTANGGIIYTPQDITDTIGVDEKGDFVNAEPNMKKIGSNISNMFGIEINNSPVKNSGFKSPEYDQYIERDCNMPHSVFFDIVSEIHKIDCSKFMPDCNNEISKLKARKLAMYAYLWFLSEKKYNDYYNSIKDYYKKINPRYYDDSHIFYDSPKEFIKDFFDVFYNYVSNACYELYLGLYKVYFKELCEESNMYDEDDSLTEESVIFDDGCSDSIYNYYMGPYQFQLGAFFLLYDETALNGENYTDYYLHWVNELASKKLTKAASDVFDYYSYELELKHEIEKFTLKCS